MSVEELDELLKLRHLNRRKMLAAMGITGASVLSACKNSGSSNGSNTTSTTTTTTVGTDDSTDDTDTTDTADTSDDDTVDSCVLIPQETQGPYPLLAIISNSGMVRTDITEGKAGIPLTLKLKLVDVNNSCASIPYGSVYVWHCDKDGVYSGYSNQTGGVNAIGETFCRGIQDTDENGEVTFTTIYPGWYNGRITHIHFQVYLFNSAISTATSQIAFPQDVTRTVYNSSLYAARGQNTSVGSFAADNVFSDGVTYQLADVSGDISSGYEATLQVGIAI